VGSELHAAAFAAASARGLRRVWLLTTNDNLDALRFYQRRGMRIANVHRARALKPSIPTVGEHGIEVHDEIELESCAIYFREDATLPRPGAYLPVQADLSLTCRRTVEADGKPNRDRDPQARSCSPNRSPEGLEGREPLRVMRRPDWIRAFAGRAGIERRDAAERSALHIAFELGGSLTWGEAQSLAEEVPEPLASALRAGSYGTAMARFSAMAFISRIAERDGVSLEQARRRVTAFLAILREELPYSRLEHLEEELASWKAELPV